MTAKIARRTPGPRRRETTSAAGYGPRRSLRPVSSAELIANSPIDAGRSGVATVPRVVTVVVNYRHYHDATPAA